ncbi:MAG: hypothetical protein MZV49_00275 [Rhodopseudomonas palustris]|nr:hypothetical protein [Rhodopseudomonas palustris]
MTAASTSRFLASGNAGIRAGLRLPAGGCEVAHVLADHVKGVCGEIHAAERAVAPDAAMVHQAVTLVGVLAAHDGGLVGHRRLTADHLGGDGGHLVHGEVAPHEQDGHADEEGEDALRSEVLELPWVLPPVGG